MFYLRQIVAPTALITYEVLASQRTEGQLRQKFRTFVLKGKVGVSRTKSGKLKTYLSSELFRILQIINDTN